MTTGLLVTTVGRQKLAAFAAGGAAVTISHIAVGDANGVPYAPAEAQTALVNEKYRMTVSSLGVTSEPAVNVEAIFPADTPDALNRPSNGFFVHELGVFDNTGALIAVARMGGGFKPAPTAGQASSRVLIAKLYFSNANSIVASVDAALWTHIGRMHGLYFLAHGGVLNAPPVSPAVGAFYIVGSAPTGAFAGQAGKVTQWTGQMWVFRTAPVGMLVVDQSISDNTSASKWMRRNQAGDAWETATASATNIGLARSATNAEAIAGNVSNIFIDPDDLRAVLDLRVQPPTVNDATITAPPATPAEGDAYIVPTGATGAWAGLVGRIAQWWGGAWRSTTAGLHQIVANRAVAITQPGAYLRRTAGGWVNFVASVTEYGLTRLATLTEAKDATRTDIALTPAALNEATASKTLICAMAANQTIPSGAFTPIIWGATVQASEYVTMNASTGRATFVRAGQYEIKFAVPFTAALTSSQVAIEFKKNLVGGGSVSDRPADGAVSNSLNMGDSASINFAVGDSLDITPFIAGGATLLNASSTRGYLKITRVGA